MLSCSRMEHHDKDSGDLVWADEFDEAARPNTERWTNQTGGHGWGNDERQYYTRRPENARIEDGHLIVEARKESYENRAYTSARLHTDEAWTYGRIEVRAKMPRGRGTWAAVWMLPEEITYGERLWPKNGEIDIVEHVGHRPDLVHGGVHTAAYNHEDETKKSASFRLDDARSSFNVYGLRWTPRKIQMSVNGQVYFTYNKPPKAGVNQWPFDQNFYLLLNVAVGGRWGGVEGIDPDIWPQQMVVDYVRVYRL